MDSISEIERSALQEILAEHVSCVVATLDGAAPWLTAMYMGYEFDEAGVPTLYAAQHLGSRAARNAGARPDVAVFVGGREPTRWLQIAATAQLVPEDRHPHARTVLVSNAPEAAGYVQMAIDRSGGVTYLAIRPTRIEVRDLTRTPPVFANLDVSS